MQALEHRTTHGPQPVSARRSPASSRQRRQVSKYLTLVAFITPAFALFVIFVIWPVIEAARYSLYRWNGLGPLVDFAGLKNYQRLFHDPIFFQALHNTLIIALLSLTIQLPLALLMALLVNGRIPGRSFFRVLFFLPYVLSEVVTGLIWSFIYEPSYGIAAFVYHALHISAPPPALLGDVRLTLFAIFAVMCWKYFGFHFILYVAGLQQIPAEVIEAARIDGANAWQVARNITIPLLGSTLRLSIFLSILGSLQYFDLIYVMSDGGPVHSSETMATYLIHAGFQSFELGYGSTVGVVMFMICLVFALFYQRVIMRRDFASQSSSIL